MSDLNVEMYRFKHSCKGGLWCPTKDAMSYKVETDLTEALWVSLRGPDMPPRVVILTMEALDNSLMMQRDLVMALLREAQL